MPTLNTSDLSSFLLPTSSINFHFDFHFFLPIEVFDSGDSQDARIMHSDLAGGHEFSAKKARKGKKI